MNQFWMGQPPSGGCVLKQIRAHSRNVKLPQPPSGGCVLKHRLGGVPKQTYIQPPSGGCVLKLTIKFPIYLLVSSRLRAAVC